MRRLLVLAFLVPVFSGASTTIDLTLAGNAVGTNTFEIAADGTFTSVTTAAIGPQKISSTLKGVLRQGKILEFTLEEAAGPAKGKIVWKGGKANIWQGDKQVRTDLPIKPKSNAFFTTFHPQVVQTFFALPEGTSKTTMFDLNSLTDIPIELKREQSTVVLKSGAIPVRKLSFTVSGIEIRYAAGLDKPDIVGMHVPAQQFMGVARGFEGVFVDPMSLYPELSQPTHKTIAETRVRAAMRDGQRMMMDITRPAGDGKHPVILVRTPYGRASQVVMLGEFYAKRGYAVVVQDVRGTGGSDGQFDPFNTNVADGKDTLDWLVQQPWCDGNVGMIGGSYVASVQWAAAVNHHPALKAIIPQVSPPEPTRNVPWDHGAFMLAGGAWWARIVKDRKADMAMASRGISDLKPLLTLPLAKVDDAMFGENVPFYDLWLKRPFASDWKGAYTTEQVGKVKIPVLHVSGVWDGDAIGTKLHWEARRQNGHTNQWLIYGPWEHAFNVKTKLGDQDYGSGSVLELDSVYLRFFDTWLKGKDVKWSEQPRVRFFETGSNRWLTGADWPLPSAKPLTLYLTGGDANGIKGTGALAAKAGQGRRDSYKYDPNKPAAKTAGFEVDSTKANLTRPSSVFTHDLLVYRTAAFEAPTSLTGPFTADLFVSTSVKDATFHIVLFDEDPKGNWTIVGQPGQRRIGWKDGRFGPVQPNHIKRIQIEPWEFARQFKKGHRLVVTIQSDLFPNFARNPGTGEPDISAAKLLKATQTVYKGAKYPSKVTLYRIP
jgi:putative CocE/NonD family hydrolase